MTRDAVAVRDDWWYLILALPLYLVLASLFISTTGINPWIIQFVFIVAYPIAVWKDLKYLRQTDHHWKPNHVWTILASVIVAFSIGILSFLFTPYYFYKRESGRPSDTTSGRSTAGTCSNCGQDIAGSNMKTVRTDGGSITEWCEPCFYRGIKGTQKMSQSQQESQQNESSDVGSNTADCDQCGQEFEQTKGKEIRLTDGGVVTCCPSCYRQLTEEQSGDSFEKICESCESSFDFDLPLVEFISGDEVRLCPNCRRQFEEEGIVHSVKLTEAEARQILEVSEGATETDIRQSYRKKVKLVHPDQKTGSREEFIRVQAARDALLS